LLPLPNKESGCTLQPSEMKADGFI